MTDDTEAHRGAWTATALWPMIVISIFAALLTGVSGCAQRALSPSPQGVHLDVTVFYAPQWQIAEEAKGRGLSAHGDFLSAATVRGFYDQSRKEIWALEGEVPDSLAAAGHELRHAVDDAAGRPNFHGDMIVDLQDLSLVNPFLHSSTPLKSMK
jgi:hypothetical protein